MKGMLLVAAISAALAGCTSYGNPALTNAGLAILSASSPPPQPVYTPTTTRCTRHGNIVNCRSF